MSGEELYRLYVEEQVKLGIGVDAWEFMDDSERYVWCQVAYRIANAV